MKRWEVKVSISKQIKEEALGLAEEWSETGYKEVFGLGFGKKSKEYKKPFESLKNVGKITGKINRLVFLPKDCFHYSPTADFNKKGKFALDRVDTYHKLLNNFLELEPVCSIHSHTPYSVDEFPEYKRKEIKKAKKMMKATRTGALPSKNDLFLQRQREKAGYPLGMILLGEKREEVLVYKLHENISKKNLKNRLKTTPYEALMDKRGLNYFSCGEVNTREEESVKRELDLCEYDLKIFETSKIHSEVKRKSELVKKTRERVENYKDPASLISILCRKNRVTLKNNLNF